MKWTYKNAFKKIQAKKTYTGLSLSFYFFDEKKTILKGDGSKLCGGNSGGQYYHCVVVCF